MILHNALLYFAYLRSLPEHTDMTIATDDIIALRQALIITPLMLQHCRGC